MVDVREFRKQLQALVEARNRYKAAMISQLTIKQELSICTQHSPVLKRFVEKTLTATEDMKIDGVPLVPEPVVSGLSTSAEKRLNELEDLGEMMSEEERDEYEELIRAERRSPHCETGLVGCIMILSSVAVLGSVAVRFFARNALAPVVKGIYPTDIGSGLDYKDDHWHLTDGSTIGLPPGLRRRLGFQTYEQVEKYLENLETWMQQRLEVTHQEAKGQQQTAEKGPLLEPKYWAWKNEHTDVKKVLESQHTMLTQMQTEMQNQQVWQQVQERVARIFQEGRAVIDQLNNELMDPGVLIRRFAAIAVHPDKRKDFVDAVRNYVNEQDARLKNSQSYTQFQRQEFTGMHDVGPTGMMVD